MEKGNKDFPLAQEKRIDLIEKLGEFDEKMAELVIEREDYENIASSEIIRYSNKQALKRA